MSKKILPPLLIPLGKAIRDARLDFRMSTMALSAEVKLAPSTLRQIEAGTCGRLMCVRKGASTVLTPRAERERASPSHVSLLAASAAPKPDRTPP